MHRTITDAAEQLQRLRLPPAQLAGAERVDYSSGASARCRRRRYPTCRRSGCAGGRGRILVEWFGRRRASRSDLDCDCRRLFMQPNGVSITLERFIRAAAAGRSFFSSIHSFPARIR